LHHASFRAGYTGSRPDVEALLPTNINKVLDVGCSTGALGASIKGFTGAVVVGIEFDTVMAEVAKRNIDRVYTGDATEVFRNGALGDEKFDAIIFADVLEHMVDPWTTLRYAVCHLSSDGVIITSIPNIRFYNSIFNVALLGIWPYRDRGIHDRTHLRFFTLWNMKELFCQAGLQIDSQSVNYRFLERPHRINQLAKYFMVPGFKQFFAYQYIHRLKRK
jgi:2-polyprenyl-3-methyl-5-hydroxy-6-metoxy-1,4-benzoquinol methylase